MEQETTKTETVNEESFYKVFSDNFMIIGRQFLSIKVPREAANNDKAIIVT